jgi:F0F1-type ATP synthase assembly protein I
VAAFGRKAYGLATSRGFGNAMGRGFELAVTLLIMVGLGWLVDNVFDTKPLFIIIFSVLGFAGLLFAWLLRARETGPHGHGLETITTSSPRA